MDNLLGELLGTMFLIILGDGVVANVLLARSKGENSGLDRHNHRLGHGRYGRCLCSHFCRRASGRH